MEIVFFDRWRQIVAREAAVSSHPTASGTVSLTGRAEGRWFHSHGKFWKCDKIRTDTESCADVGKTALTVALSKKSLKTILSSKNVHKDKAEP